MELIDKSVIVAVIKKKLDKYSKLHSFNYGAVKDLESLLDFLDTFEVKEVDLDEEFDKYCDNLYLIDLENEPYAELFECAKHFYELGLKARKGE